MPLLLHVGCGSKRKNQTTHGFLKEEWKELRLDIDSSVKPDILGSITNLSAIEDASVDAVFSSHNIEHLYPHEVPIALKEFLRVLRPSGFIIVTCPDLQEVCRLVAEDKLLESAYTSPAGPITPLDMLYGFRSAMANGNLYMAHRCGFTQSVLAKTLHGSGFLSVACKRRKHPHYDLYALATKNEIDQSVLQNLAEEHFPS